MKLFISNQDLITQKDIGQSLDKLTFTDQEIINLYTDPNCPSELKMNIQERYNRINLEIKRQEEFEKTKIVNEIFFHGDNFLHQNKFDEALRKYEEGLAIMPNSYELRRRYDQKVNEVKLAREKEEKKQRDQQRLIEEENCRKQEAEKKRLEEIERQEKMKLSLSQKELDRIEKRKKELFGRPSLYKPQPINKPVSNTTQTNTNTNTNTTNLVQATVQKGGGIGKYVATSILAVLLFAGLEAKNKLQNYSQSKEIETILADKIVTKDGVKKVIAAYIKQGKFKEDADSFLLYINGKTRFFNKYGESHISASYQNQVHFGKGNAIIKKDNYFFLVNKDGDIVDTDYEIHSMFNNGYAIISKYERGTNGRTRNYYIMNSNLEKISTPLEHIIFSDGIYLLESKNGRYYFCDANLKQLPGFYSRANCFSEGLANVYDQQKKERYFIDKTGNKVLGPYRIAGMFISGYAPVYINNDTCYFIDKNGNKVFGPYESIYDFSEGMAVISKNKKYYYLSLEGKEIGPYDLAERFSHGLGSVRDGKEWFYVDKTGKKVLGPYRSAKPFNDSGFATVQGWFGMKEINTKGDTVNID